MPHRPTAVVIHGHFYQPPREDPRTGEVPLDPTAAPYHDWNRRVHDECYRALVGGRILDHEGRIAAIVNTAEWMSWDAGPTLLRWMARETPGTYRALLEADARSRRRLGHGNALASPYHHVILPLASRRDKVTEVRWGIADFERRFGRRPEGLWLPETAVDVESLDVLAREGIAFTILAPHQVEEPPPGGAPGIVRLGGGRSIVVFVYDGGLSHGVAFGELLKSAEAWLARLEERGREPGTRLVSLATDAETFGHHHKWADMALAAVLTGAERSRTLRLESYASYLAKHPPEHDIELVEPSSWSCAHGVDRWRADCGCRAAPHMQSQQAWRTVLRESLEELARDLDGLFEAEGARVFEDPWATRDAYGRVIDAGEGTARALVEAHAAAGASEHDRSRALELLDMQLHTLGMFTSCGWFFDDIGGVEPVQVLRYAARAIDLAGPAAEPWERRLEDRLEDALSNDPRVGHGARVWRERVRGGAPPPPPLEASPVQAVRKAKPAPEPDPARKAAADRLLDSVRRLARSPSPEVASDVASLVALAGPAAERVLPDARVIFAATEPWSAPPSPELLSAALSLGFGERIFEAPPLGAAAPLPFVFGVHLHQPVGNFDQVFHDHTEHVYLPFLERISKSALLPLTLHVSGPLLDWLEARGHRLLDLVGRMAADGQVELLLSGFYEPVLAALPRADRREQIAWMRERLRSRFGVEATGLWLTERVWEPGLAGDLALEGVRHVLVDDRHFVVSGFEPGRLSRPFHTEAEGGTVALLPIDEQLRYMVPFRPADDIEAYLRGLRAEGRPLAVLVDDGEKFGGWPGTADWVWKSGWMDAFLASVERMVDDRAVEVVTSARAAETVPSGGAAYLPTASYREMEGWSLPPVAARRLEAVEEELGATHPDGQWTGVVRGGHWKNFLARYAESGRMHHKACALSALCRERGDPPEARHAIGRAQCNDAYWHGVFGGLYLRHLRGSVWYNLAEAERILRAGEGLTHEMLDFDRDGRPDVWVHSSTFSAVVDPSHGGAITDLTHLASGRNLADTLTRRREAYHRVKDRPAAHGAHEPGGTPSIHEIEGGLGFSSLPPFDREERAILVDRVLAAELGEGAYAAGDYDPLMSWAGAHAEAEIENAGDTLTIRLRLPGAAPLEKRLDFAADGSVTATYTWDPVSLPPDALFAPELSLLQELPLELEPEPVAVWRYEIRTVSKSEAGAEESVQGISLTPLWRCRVGRAVVRIPTPGWS